MSTAKPSGDRPRIRWYRTIQRRTDYVPSPDVLLAREAASGQLRKLDDPREMLKTLTEATSRFVNNLPKARKAEKELRALRKAIAQANRVLAAKNLV